MDMDMMPWEGQREKIFLDRYAAKDLEGNPTEQTVEEMWWRVSKAVAEDGKEQSLFYIILDKFQFVPGGRILAGERSLYNCFVLSFESGTTGADSRGSIMSTIGDLVEITAQGGGVGINWSVLRPRNTYIKGVRGKSSGSISWMRGADGLADVIRQGGSRTAACMFMLDCWHPDVVEFTRAISRFKRANFSVNISDEFMRAVKHDADWDLIFPDTDSPFYDREWNGDIQDWKNKQLPVIVHDTVKARYLWKAIAESAYMIGSPGLAFMNRCNEWSNTRYLHKLICFNPCFTGEMELLTSTGYQKLEDIIGEIDVAKIGGGFSKGKVWQSGIKKIVEIVLTNREVLKSTPDQLFMTIDGSECPAENLEGKQLMPNLDCYKNFDRKFIKLGFIQGDGELSRLNSKYHLGIEVNIGIKDKGLIHLFDGDDFTVSKRKIYLVGYNEILTELGFFPVISSERKFPSTYPKWKSIEKRSFIRGCYSANGSVITHSRVGYKTTSKIFAEQMKKTLAEDFDIESFITTTKATKVKFSNGTYLCREAYEVYIGKYTSIRKFFENISFELPYRQETLIETLKLHSPKVRFVRDIGEAMVYDFSEPESNWGIINGYVAHNCGEQPLPANGSCNLGSMNLLSFMNDGEFSFDRLKLVIRYAVRFLDRAIDVSEDINKEIGDMQRQVRRIGLGTMGLADIFILHDIRYGSDESILFIHKLYSFIRDAAYEASINLAKEKGPAPGFHLESVLESKFIKTLPAELIRGITEHGLRNLSLLTNAPTGTTSILAGTSNGIEPIFSREYTRKDNTGCAMVKHPLADNSAMVTAKNIDIRDQIRVQSVIQMYMDASISKTINLPEDCTIEDIMEAYELAYDLNCKGITVYRANSLEDVLCESCNL